MTEGTNGEVTLLECSEKFRAWTEKVESICMTAVFKQQRDIIQQVYDHLEEKEKALKALVDLVHHHLGKSSNNAVSSAPTFPPAAQKDTNGAAVGRMAASFPLMSSLFPPGTAPSSLPPAYETLAVSAPPPFPGFSKINGKSVPPPWHNPNSKNTLPNNWRDDDGRPDPGPIGPPAQLQQLAHSADDRSSVDSSGSGEVIPKKVFVTNLARESDARTIAKYFNQFGPVADVKIFRFQNGESRGFGAVEFADIGGAEKAIDISKHIIDRREVVALPFKETNKDKPSEKPTKRFQIFLGGVPTFLSKPEVEAAIRKYCKVRELKVNSERGYGYLDLENESDVERILANGYIKIGEKMVECKLNKRY